MNKVERDCLSKIIDDLTLNYSSLLVLLDRVEIEENKIKNICECLNNLIGLLSDVEEINDERDE